MKTVVVGSHNPVKLETTKEAFALCYPNEEFVFETLSAEPGVSDQPMGQDETKKGAQNRAEYCVTERPGADFYVGLEGGLERIADEYWVSAWMCVIDTNGKYGFGRTSAFVLPERVRELIDAGEELGIATDIAFNETNSKHKGGAVSVLTNELITRKDFYRDAIIFALIPFRKPDLY